MLISTRQCPSTNRERLEKLERIVTDLRPCFNNGFIEKTSEMRGNGGNAVCEAHSKGQRPMSKNKNGNGPICWSNYFGWCCKKNLRDRQ